MNSNNNVEQGAGPDPVLGRARPTRWACPATAGCSPTPAPTPTTTGSCPTGPTCARRRPSASPARRALELAGIDVDDLAHVDLYSCFPSAVQIAAAELGLDLDRPLTVTGGMSFAGGPWNNYPMHAIATMAGLLRDDPGALGLCTANGGYTTKHAFGIYGATTARPRASATTTCRPRSTPPPAGRRPTTTPGRSPSRATRSCTTARASPRRALFALLTAEGARTWGTTHDGATMDELIATEAVGHGADLDADGHVHLT